MKKILTAVAMTFLSTLAVACGTSDSSVSNDGPGDDNDIVEATPTPEPTPEPTPKSYPVRITLTNLHIYENSEPFGAGELYFTFAVGDTVRYSTQISAGNNTDYNPSDYGLTPIDIEVLEGDPIYIYVDGYDDDQPNGNDPMGTVNTGWYAGDAMIGEHAVAGENPYLYDVTYRIDWAQ